MSVAEIRAYLSDLAIENNVAASTQNVALSALLFPYRQFLGINGERSPFRRLRTRAIAINVNFRHRMSIISRSCQIKSYHILQGGKVLIFR